MGTIILPMGLQPRENIRKRYDQNFDLFIIITMCDKNRTENYFFHILNKKFAQHHLLLFLSSSSMAYIYSISSIFSFRISSIAL